MGDTRPRPPTRGSLPDGPHATPLSAPPHPNAPRADTCTRASRRCPCTAGRDIAEDATPQHRGGKSRAARAALGTCVRHQDTCSLSGEKPQLGGSSGRHDGHPWRRAHAVARKRNTPPPRARPDARAKAPVWRVRAREGVSVGVNGQRPHARCAAPSSGTTSLYPRATRLSICTRPSASRGAGEATHAWCVRGLVVGGARTQREPRRTSRGTTLVRECAVEAWEQGYDAGETALNTPVPRHRSRKRERERPHLGGQGVDGRSAADGRRRRKRELTWGSEAPCAFDAHGGSHVFRILREQPWAPLERSNPGRRPRRMTNDRIRVVVRPHGSAPYPCHALPLALLVPRTRPSFCRRRRPLELGLPRCAPELPAKGSAQHRQPHGASRLRTWRTRRTVAERADLGTRRR